jgi:hypothetical protein
MKAKWNALLAWLKALFAKAPVTPAAPSTVPEVAPPQAVVDPVITKPVEPKPVNRFTPYLAKYGNDLWAVMTGERINIDRAGYEEALAAGFTKNQAFEDAYLAGRNDQAVGPAFNARKTILDASDVGGLFEPQAGTTSYTVTGPLKVFLSAIVPRGTCQPGGIRCGTTWWLDEVQAAYPSQSFHEEPSFPLKLRGRRGELSANSDCILSS